MGNAGNDTKRKVWWCSLWTDADGGMHVRLRRVGTIFSSHEGPGDISMVAVMAMMINDQNRKRTRGLNVEKEEGVSDGQG